MKAVQYVQKLKSERSGRPQVETLGKPMIIGDKPTYMYSS